jgi:hypothetical protein
MIYNTFQLPSETLMVSRRIPQGEEATLDVE